MGNVSKRAGAPVGSSRSTETRKRNCERLAVLFWMTPELPVAPGIFGANETTSSRRISNARRTWKAIWQCGWALFGNPFTCERKLHEENVALFQTNYEFCVEFAEIMEKSARDNEQFVSVDRIVALLRKVGTDLARLFSKTGAGFDFRTEISGNVSNFLLRRFHLAMFDRRNFCWPLLCNG